MDSQKLLGSIGSIAIAFTTVWGFGLYLIVMGIGSLVSILIGDWVLLGATIVGIVIGCIIGGYVGANSKTMGAFGGAVGGCLISGAYLWWSIGLSAIGLAIDSIGATILGMSVFILSLITILYSCVVYVLGQKAKE